jgi:hypothetical protein
MDVYEINFELKGVEYCAEVTQTDNLFRISIDDDLIGRYVNEIYLELRPDGEFVWKSPKSINSLQMDFMIAIVPAIRKHMA